MAWSSKLRGGEHGWLENDEWVDGPSEWVAECTRDTILQQRTLSVCIVPSQGLHHKPLTCANVANPRSVGGWCRRSSIKTNTRRRSHIRQPLMLFCSAHASLHATATQTILPMREQLPPEGHHHKTWKLQISKRKLLVSWDRFLVLAEWAFELEMHLKAEELPGGTVLQGRTVQIREENAHFFGMN